MAKVVRLRMKTKYIVMIGIIGVLLLASIGVGFSYALWQANYEQEEPNVINTACFNLLFEEQSASINLDNSYPMSDEEGMEIDPFNFSVKNECGTQAKYTITIDIMDTTTIDLDKIKMDIEGLIDKKILTTLESEESTESGVRISYVLNVDYLTEGQEHEYSLRIWLDDSADNEEMNKTFEGRVTLKAIQNDDELTTDFAYTGTMQEFIVPRDGYYEVELWGGALDLTGRGYGGYTKGTIYLEKDEVLYFYVGQKVGSAYASTRFNGGGASGVGGRSGAGATDVRLVRASATPTVWNNSASLRSRIMVAGGSSGCDSSGISGTYYGSSGGLIGDAGSKNGSAVSTTVLGGSQTTGGTADADSVAGVFGIGGKANASSGDYGGGGGGGYYGGGGMTGSGGGGGGSSYISGYAGVNSIQETGGTAAQPLHTNNTIHYSGRYFINGYMDYGYFGNDGQAKIRYIGKPLLRRANTKLSNVRYIKSCINGSNISVTNAWSEIQALKNGVNIAKGKSVTGTVSQNSSYPYSKIVDGIVETGSNGRPSVNGLQCVTIDLGAVYDLDEVTLWNTVTNTERVFYENSLSVGLENIDGTSSLDVVLHTYSGTNGYNESINGRRYTAWDTE